jgi:dUTP pyrophosphatase
MNFLLNGKRVRRMGYYVPGLGTTLISIRQHIRYKGCYFHAENDTVLLAYPKAVIHTTTDPEFILTISPAKHLTLPYVFDESRAILSLNADRRKFEVINPAKAKYMATEKDKTTLIQSVRIKKIVNHAKLPKRATPGSIGFDVSSAQHAALLPNQVTKVHTGLAVQVPKGLYLRIAPRSGLSLRGLSVEAGVVDNDYTGEVIILLRNHTNKIINIKEGQRAAQFIFEQASIPCITITKELSQTKRNTNNFGSTDANKIYSKTNKSEAIACALRIIMETKARLAKTTASMYDEDEDIGYAEYMKSSHQQMTEKQNNHSSTHYAAENLDTPSNKTSLQDLPQTRVTASLPLHMSLTKDFIFQSTGFHKSDSLIKYFHTISDKSVSIASTPK